MTLIELLESLEAAVAARQSDPDAPVAAPSLVRRAGISSEVNYTFPNETAEEHLSPSLLAGHMERAGLTNAEFSSIFGVPPGVLQDWLKGTSAVPSWVVPAIQMLYLLSPAVRQRLLVGAKSPQETKKTASSPKQIRSHPFSHIEDF